MNRTGLAIAFTVAAVIGIVFAMYPELDIALSAVFHEGRFGGWMGLQRAWSLPLRHLVSGLIALIVAPAIVALVLKVIRPRRPLLIPGRAIVLMISTLVIAPGLISNVILKDNWNRSRPFHIKEFGGSQQFRPWWDPRGTCRGNCSFVAGEPSGAFWTMAPAAVVPPVWRVAAYGAALTFGTVVGVLRMSAGAHFFTDVVFAGVITFLVIWLVHGLLYRWGPMRVSGPEPRD